MKISKLTLFLYLFFVTIISVNAQQPVVVKKIWDEGKHNAFPDIIFAKGYYYATFREGSSHIDNSNDGQVRVIRSKDLSTWEKVALFQHESADVREARLSVMPDGRILANLAVGFWKDGYQWLRPYVSISDKSGKEFSEIALAEVDSSIDPARDWIWRLTWHNGIGYGIMYRVFSESTKPWEALVVKTTDGKNYTYVSQIPVDGQPNESTIRFDKNGNMYVMVRREAGDKLGALAKATYPYTSWNFNQLNWQLGGPNFMFLNDHTLIMGSRYKQKEGSKTGLFVTDLEGNIAKTIELPSGGDNSYPGFVIRENQLIVVYYSSHDEKTSIYLTKVPLKDL